MLFWGTQTLKYEHTARPLPLCICQQEWLPFLKRKEFTQDLFFSPKPLVLTNVNDSIVMGQKELYI